MQANSHAVTPCPPPADDYAPAAVKASWFAAFYLCIPVGFALGYIVGGLVAPALGWRWAFILEALPLLPFVAFCLTAQPLHMHGMKDTKAATHGSEGGGSSGPGHKGGRGAWALGQVQVAVVSETGAGMGIDKAAWGPQVCVRWGKTVSGLA